MPFQKRKQFPRCINCGLKLYRNSHIVLQKLNESINCDVLKRWISPAQISVGDGLCLECYKLLSFCQPDDKPSQGHRVCFGCGRSLLSFKKDSTVLVGQPELDIIKEWTLPHLVNKIEKVCNPCFFDAKKMAEERGLYNNTENKMSSKPELEKQVIKQESTDTEVNSECIDYPELLEIEKENIATNTSQQSSSNSSYMGNKVKVEYIEPLTPQTKNAPMSSYRKSLSNYLNADKNVSISGNMSQEFKAKDLETPIPQTENEPTVAIAAHKQELPHKSSRKVLRNLKYKRNIQRNCQYHRLRNPHLQE